MAKKWEHPGSAKKKGYSYKKKCIVHKFHGIGEEKTVFCLAEELRIKRPFFLLDDADGAEGEVYRGPAGTKRPMQRG